MTTPSPKLTAVTLGVRDVPASARFYEALGFKRKFRATGDEIAFFDAGGVVLALWDRDKLAEDSVVSSQPGPRRFAGRRSPGTARHRSRSILLSRRRWRLAPACCAVRRKPNTAATADIFPIRTDTSGRWCRLPAWRLRMMAG